MKSILMFAAIKKIIQRSHEGLTEVLKEVRLLSQLSHPAVVRYYNTWLEEVYGSSEAADEDMSTEAGTIEYSQASTTRGGPDTEYAASQGGLDFISSSRHVSMTGADDEFAIEFGSDSEAGEDDDDHDDDEDDDEQEEEEDDEDELQSDSDEVSDSDSEEDSERKESAPHAKLLTLPERRRDRRLSHRPFRTIMYISMEYCEKRVSDRVSPNTALLPFQTVPTIIAGLVAPLYHWLFESKLTTTRLFEI